jgi:hypothetical protein
MDAISHLLRRSRLRSFSSKSHVGHFPRAAIHDNVSDESENALLDSLDEQADVVYLEERFYASLNQFSPEELSSIASASSAAATVSSHYWLGKYRRLMMRRLKEQLQR